MLTRRIAAATAILTIVYGAYLAARVVQERQRAPAAVQRILRSSDPAVSATPAARLNMLVQVEDPSFYTNDGIDLSSPGGGFTTISQGLGKIVLFDHFRPGLQKIELMVLTRFALTPTVSKHDILVAFLNAAYLGHDADGEIRGFAEGSRRWLGKPFDSLTDAEFLSLVAMLPAPNQLDPARNGRANRERVRRIERLLRNQCKPAGVRDVALDGCAA